MNAEEAKLLSARADVIPYIEAIDATIREEAAKGKRQIFPLSTVATVASRPTKEQERVLRDYYDKRGFAWTYHGHSPTLSW